MHDNMPVKDAQPNIGDAGVELRTALAKINISHTSLTLKIFAEIDFCTLCGGISRRGGRFVAHFRDERSTSQKWHGRADKKTSPTAIDTYEIFGDFFLMSASKIKSKIDRVSHRIMRWIVGSAHLSQVEATMVGKRSRQLRSQQRHTGYI